jgi:DASS family divalent anion:Na+ symporter
MGTVAFQITVAPFAKNPSSVDSISPAVATGAPPLLAALLLCFFSNLNSTLTHYSDGAAPIYYGSQYIDQADWWRIGFYLSVFHLTLWLAVGLPWWKFLGIW